MGSYIAQLTALDRFSPHCLEATWKQGDLFAGEYSAESSA